MNNITTFNNPAFGSVRAVSVNDEPYFVGKDVAEIAGRHGHINRVAHFDLSL